MWGSNPRPGDWVATTRTEHLGLVDALTGAGLPAGTKAVVVSRDGSWATVRAESGWGTVDLSVAARHLRVTHRGRGEEAFVRHASWRAAVRTGAFAALALPVVWFALEFIWKNHTLSGLPAALAVWFVDSTLGTLVDFINDPVRALIVTAIGMLAARLAFGRHGGKR